MKNLLMLVVALLTTTMLFAATQTPEAKGKEYAKRSVLLILEEDYDEAEAIGEQMGEYMLSLNDESLEIFLDAYFKGLYYYCEYYGLGEDALELFLESHAVGLLGESYVL